jgi:uncharacterized delta-60 repeat protein
MSFRALSRCLSSVWTSSAAPGRRPARTATPRVEALEARNLMAAGALDTTFATLGKLTRPIDLGGARNDVLSAVAIQADGKIVAVGTADTSSSGASAFVVLRFNANGTLDTSFGNFGRQVISFGSFGRANAVAIDRFGRIVVAGTANPFGDNDFAVARLTPSGQLDTSFDGDGIRTVAIDIHGDSADDEATAVAIDAQGRIVLGGFADSGGSDFDFAVVRLTTNGSLDTTFDGDGKQTVAFNLGDGGLTNADFARSLAIDKAGRIVIAGTAFTGGFGSVMAVARLTPGGKLDTTFSGDGKQTVAFDLPHPIDFSAANAVAIDPQGRIVLAGSSVVRGHGDDMAVARLLANGSLDTSFGGGGGGRQTIGFDRGGGLNDVANALAIDPFGNIVIVGTADRDSHFNTDMAVTRLKANGALDSNFGVGGKTTVSFNGALPGNPSFAAAVAIDAQGRIVVGGSAKFFSPDFDFALARLLSTQPLNTHPVGSIGGLANI